MTGYRRRTGRALAPVATTHRQDEHYRRLASEAPTTHERIRVMGEHLAALARRAAPDVGDRITADLGTLIATIRRENFS